MTSILSWNIQNGKGIDGNISLARIAKVIADMGSPDVICLQEISRGLALDENGYAPDQISELGKLYPDYKIIFGIAVDAISNGTGKRWQFGNATLVKIPLLAQASYVLPSPAIEGIRYMTRQATEIVIARPSGPMRVLSTHLEFHSQMQRQAQIKRLRELQHEVLEEYKKPRIIDKVGPYQFVPRPIDTVYCGDFNTNYDSAEYQALLEPLADVDMPFYDAWKIAHLGQTHRPTCGVYDHQQWPQGPHCRDFFFVTNNCVATVKDLRVNTVTDASDHQPLILELADELSAETKAKA